MLTIVPSDASILKTIKGEALTPKYTFCSKASILRLFENGKYEYTAVQTNISFVSIFLTTVVSGVDTYRNYFETINVW